MILTCWAPVTAQVIDAADRCRHIARTGIGLDNIDVPRATERGIVVTNVPDYCINEVAEHTLALIFALGRNIAGYHLATKNGQYDLVAGLPVERISGKTLGIIGLGQIGKIARRRAPPPSACGSSARTAPAKRPPGVEWLSLDELARRERLRLGPSAAHARDAAPHQPRHAPPDEALGLSDQHLPRRPGRPRGPGRGPGGKTASPGPASTCRSREPPDLSQPPYNDPRVVVTPHVAFYSSQATDELRTRVGRQAAAFLRGERPENVVNPRPAT